jgi:uncharacterized membrane protein YbhN (UPF0104 family)
MTRLLHLPDLPPIAARLLRLFTSLAVLAVLAVTIGGEDLLERLKRADPGWLLAAFVALNAQTILCAVRWRLTAAQFGLRIRIMRAVGEYYMGQLINQVVPGGVVGDVGRAARTRHAAGLLRASQAVVLERAAGQIALLAIAVVAIPVTAAAPGGLRWPTEWTWSALIAGSALVGAAVLARRSLWRWLPARVTDALGMSWQALAGPEVRRAQTSLSLGTAACNILAFSFCAWATGTDIGLGTAAALVPVILVAMLVPFGIGGWGFREGAAAALWPLIGASAGAGVAASVAFGAMLLAASLPGLAPLVATGRVAAAGPVAGPTRPASAAGSRRPR